MLNATFLPSPRHHSCPLSLSSICFFDLLRRSSVDQIWLDMYSDLTTRFWCVCGCVIVLTPNQKYIQCWPRTKNENKKKKNVWFLLSLLYIHICMCVRSCEEKNLGSGDNTRAYYLTICSNLCFSINNILVFFILKYHYWWSGGV